MLTVRNHVRFTFRYLQFAVGRIILRKMLAVDDPWLYVTTLLHSLEPFTSLGNWFHWVSMQPDSTGSFDFILNPLSMLSRPKKKSGSPRQDDGPVV